MATLFLAAVDSDVVMSTIFVAVIAACLVAWIILYFVSPRVHEMTQEVRRNIATGIRQGKSGAASPPSIISIQSSDALDRITADIGTALAGDGYVSQGSQPGLYTYSKHERPSAIIAVLLFFLCFIPGIVYLVRGDKTLIVTVRFLEVGEGRFRVVAEGPAKAIVQRAIEPYAVAR